MQDKIGVFTPQKREFSHNADSSSQFKESATHIVNFNQMSSVDISEDLPDFYQTQWEEYYNQLAEAESVESPTTYNKVPDFASLINKNAIKNKQDFLAGMDVSILFTQNPKT